MSTTIKKITKIEPRFLQKQYTVKNTARKCQIQSQVWAGVATSP